VSEIRFDEKTSTRVYDRNSEITFLYVSNLVFSKLKRHGGAFRKTLVRSVGCDEPRRISCTRSRTRPIEALPWFRFEPCDHTLTSSEIPGLIPIPVRLDVEPVFSR